MKSTKNNHFFTQICFTLVAICNKKMKLNETLLIIFLPKKSPNNSDNNDLNFDGKHGYVCEPAYFVGKLKNGNHS